MWPLGLSNAEARGRHLRGTLMSEMSAAAWALGSLPLQCIKRNRTYDRRSKQQCRRDVLFRAVNATPWVFSLPGLWYPRARGIASTLCLAGKTPSPHRRIRQVERRG